MNRAIEFAKDIKQKQEIIKSTKRKYLKTDLTKHVKRSIKELKYYCKSKGINYCELSKEFIDKLP